MDYEMLHTSDAIIKRPANKSEYSCTFPFFNSFLDRYRNTTISFDTIISNTFCDKLGSWTPALSQTQERYVGLTRFSEDGSPVWQLLCSLYGTGREFKAVRLAGDLQLMQTDVTKLALFEFDGTEGDTMPLPSSTLMALYDKYVCDSFDTDAALQSSLRTPTFLLPNRYQLACEFERGRIAASRRLEKSPWRLISMLLRQTPWDVEPHLWSIYHYASEVFRAGNLDRLDARRHGLEFEPIPYVCYTRRPLREKAFAAGLTFSVLEYLQLQAQGNLKSL